MSAVGAIKDLWLIQNAVGFVSIIKWHIINLHKIKEMKKKIEKDKMADIECSVMVKLNTEIAKKFDEYIVEGLKRKGFEFETKWELISFISNNCTCEVDNDLECRVYLVNGLPFFAYYPKLVPECDYSKINEPVFTFDLGYFSYID